MMETTGILAVALLAIPLSRLQGAPFVSQGKTLLYYRFNETSASATTAVDSSGNGGNEWYHLAFSFNADDGKCSFYRSAPGASALDNRFITIGSLGVIAPSAATVNRSLFIGSQGASSVSNVFPGLIAKPGVDRPERHGGLPYRGRR